MVRLRHSVLLFAWLAAALPAAAQPDRAVDLRGAGSDVFVQGAAAGDHAGSSVVLADVNGDGIDDLIVGAPDAEVPGRAGAGAVYVLFGRRDFPGNLLVDLAVRSPDVVILGDDPGDFLGGAVAVGDVNGDGRNDIVASAWGVDEGMRGDCGAVYVIYGRATYPARIDLDATPADLTIYGRSYGDELGRTLALGDLDHDGIADIIAGAPGAAPGGRGSAGQAHVLFGRRDYPPQALVDLVGRLSDITVYGRYPFNYLGSSVASGDFNNDGIADLVVGARFASKQMVQAGEVYMLYGRPLWSTPFILDLGTGAQPDFTLIGRYSGDNLSTALAVGDVNGDGKNDLVATAWGSGPGWPGPVRTNAGEVNVIFGATFSGRYVWDLSVTPPDVRILGRAAGDRLGYGATLADLDGDGQLDIVAAAAEASPLDRNQAGTVHVFRGGAFSTTTTLDLSTTSADWEIDGAAAGDLTGRLALAAGDLNGDGQTDLAMGVPGATFGARSETGGVRLLHGGFTYLLDPPRVGTRMQIRLLARAYPGTFRLGAAALSGRLGVAIDATRTFPLDPDALLFASLSSPQLFVDYMGFLSASGEATASIAIPNLGTLAGITIYTAFVLLDPQAPASTAAVGNRVPVTFLP